MRVPLSWLAEFIDLPPPGALTDRLAMGGFDDVLIEDPGPDLSELRVGLVREATRHPNADRLSVCRVDLGEGEPVEVVCGAPNVATGQKVAVALPGTRLPDGTALKRSKIRGVVSNGMICSARELCLGEDHEGILVLDPEARVGAPLGEVLSAGERVLEFGITPNRGDLASVLGVARAVRAHFGGELRLPEVQPPEAPEPAAAAIRVEIGDADGCHRYAARIVRGLRVGPSPDWLRARLEAAGVRSINTVVDVTNLVLLEFGQPLHAFDLATLRGGLVRVRTAKAGEKLVTLDGQARELDSDDLVIADAERAIALAGVMGGAETEVGDATTDVLIESAHFRPVRVRRTARRHGIQSEASYRFERGVDREGVVRAADRAARLLAELAGGRVLADAVVTDGSPAPFTEEIELDVGRTNRLLGTGLGRDEVAALLERVGVETASPKGARVEGRGDDRLRCRIPSHRNDLRIPEDLMEEVAAVYGYDRIETTLPVAPLLGVETPRSWALAEAARDALVEVGLIECMTLPFTNAADLVSLALREAESLRVLNPVVEQNPLLRNALLPSLLRVTRQNLARQVEAVRIFEVARVFQAREGEALPDEPLTVTAVLAGVNEPRLWQPASPPPLFFHARGIAERLLKRLGYMAWLRTGPAAPCLHPGAAVEIGVGTQVVGAVGELHPEVAAHFELDVPCAVIEVDLSRLESAPVEAPHYREVSRQPLVRRDLAVLLGRAQAAGEVLEAIRKTGGGELVSAQLFDRYEGKGIPEGSVSLAFRLVFQRADRTLTDAEVARATDRIVKMLAHRFGGELR